MGRSRWSVYRDIKKRMRAIGCTHCRIRRILYGTDDLRELKSVNSSLQHENEVKNGTTSVSMDNPRTGEESHNHYNEMCPRDDRIFDAIMQLSAIIQQNSKQLALIQRSLDDQKVLLNRLLLKDNSNSSVHLPLPINSMDEWNRVEQCSVDPDYRAVMKAQIVSVITQDMKASVRAILRHLLHNDFGRLCNFIGAHGKIAFRDSKIYRVIQGELINAFPNNNVLPVAEQECIKYFKGARDRGQTRKRVKLSDCPEDSTTNGDNVGVNITL